MKYIFSLLILFGGIAGFIGAFVLFIFIVDSIQKLEQNLHCKSRKYRKFKSVLDENIMPWVVEIAFVLLILVCIVGAYFAILKRF
jgi:hypothetical protein